MGDPVQEAFIDWTKQEERANRLADGTAVRRSEAEEARKDATEAWHVYWERRWQVEQEA